MLQKSSKLPKNDRIFKKKNIFEGTNVREFCQKPRNPGKLIPIRYPCRIYYASCPTPGENKTKLKTIMYCFPDYGDSLRHPVWSPFTKLWRSCSDPHLKIRPTAIFAVYSLNCSLAARLQDNSRPMSPTKVETKRKLQQLTVSGWLVMNGGASGNEKKTRKL